jgi:hypothetical protein
MRQTHRRTAAPAKYDHIDFVPPESVAKAAERGLKLRKQQGADKAGLTPEEASKEGIGSGVQRAVNLKNRNKVSPKTIGMMVGFFARHEKNKSLSAENKSTPWKDKGYVSWLLWGGDPGKSWAEKIKKQMETADKKPQTKKADADGSYMSRGFVRQMAQQARELIDLVDQAGQLEDWQESKITSAANSLNAVYNALKYRDEPSPSRVLANWQAKKAAENEPTNPGLWEKVQKLTKGEVKSLTHGGKTIEGPNDGKGFDKFPSAYANGWASKVYKDLGGGWKKE